VHYDVKIRNAKLIDATKIAEIINYYAKDGIMLPRTENYIIERIRDFIVADIDNNVVGCCALAFFTLKLAEIRSLAVLKEYQGQGIGKMLVMKAEEILIEEGVKNVFALTLNPDFFISLGYKIVEKTNFPQKIWKDCLSCYKIMKCDEVAVEKELNKI